jgi:RNA polymerase sigma-70 factor (ECF subfamily)
VWLTEPGSAIDAPVLDPVIDRALGTLTVEQRAVVICRLLIGYSEAQTATALGLRPGTVKSRLSRATTRLHALLSPLDPSSKDDDR